MFYIISIAQTNKKSIVKLRSFLKIFQKFNLFLWNTSSPNKYGLCNEEEVIIGDNIKPFDFDLDVEKVANELIRFYEVFMPRIRNIKDRMFDYKMQQKMNRIRLTKGNGMAPVLDPAHQNGYFAHYHTYGRPKPSSHAFYGIPTAKGCY